MIRGNNSYFTKGLILDAVLMAFLIYRLLILSNDTPFGISTGQELSTDPPQYTSFARNKVLFDKYEVYHSRYTFFVNNLMTIVAYPFFEVLGTGRAQSNLVAMIFSLIVILFSYHLWKEKGFGLALLGVVFLGFNYIFMNYGSLTFLEITTLALISSGAYFLLVGNRRILFAFIAGMLFAAAAFFGKLLTVSFFILALLTLFIEMLQRNGKGWKTFNVLYSFFTGYFSVFLFWMIFVYLPAKAEVSGYVSEISTGMYGFPRALESVKMFLVQFYSYGFDIKLWSKQPIMLIAGFLGLATVLGIAIAPQKQILRKIDRIDFFHAFWLLGIFVFLFPWNYRPMRYAIIIFPPVAYLSARWLILMIRPAIEWGRRLWPYYIIIFLSGSYAAAQLLLIPKFEMRSIEVISANIPFAILSGIVLALLAFAIHKFKIFSRFQARKLHLIMVVLIICGFIIDQNRLYFENGFKFQRTISNASIDLGRILSKNAVVVGSYSSALTQENKFGSVIKMFGVPVVEKAFFNEIPATHIAIESGGGEGSNEKRAFRDYPEIMENAPIVATYYLRGYPVNVYLIAQNSPNVMARRYKPSLYESASISLRAGENKSALAMLDEFERLKGKTISSVTLKMQIESNDQQAGSNLQFLETLVKYDEGNMNYWWMLGESYLRLSPPAFDKALHSYKKALYLKPDDKSLVRQIQLLDNYADNT